MNKQTTIKPPDGLEAALAEVLPKLEGAKKNSANPHFKSKYADLGSVIDAIRPAAEHGVWFRQVLHPCENGVTVETFYTGFGEAISAGVLHMPADRNNAQGYGSALTYARRYALQTAFGLATEDDDGNEASKTEQPTKKAPAHSKLKQEIRSFVHELEGIGDWDTYVTFRDTPDFKRITAECQDKLPGWWEGWDEQPDGFVPLKDRIAMTHERCAQDKAAMLQAG